MEKIHHPEDKVYFSAGLELAEYTVEHLDSDGESSSEESSFELNDIYFDSDVFDDKNEEVPLRNEWEEPLGESKTPQKLF